MPVRLPEKLSTPIVASQHNAHAAALPRRPARRCTSACQAAM